MKCICHLWADGLCWDILHALLSVDSPAPGIEHYGLYSSERQRTHLALRFHWQRHTLSLHLSPVKNQMCVFLIFSDEQKLDLSLSTHFHSFSSSYSLNWETGTAHHLFATATAGHSCRKTRHPWPLRPHRATEQSIPCNNKQKINRCYLNILFNIIKNNI